MWNFFEFKCVLDDDELLQEDWMDDVLRASAAKLKKDRETATGRQKVIGDMASAQQARAATAVTQSPLTTNTAVAKDIDDAAPQAPAPQAPAPQAPADPNAQTTLGKILGLGGGGGGGGATEVPTDKEQQQAIIAANRPKRKPKVNTELGKWNAFIRAGYGNIAFLNFTKENGITATGPDGEQHSVEDLMKATWTYEDKMGREQHTGGLKPKIYPTTEDAHVDIAKGTFPVMIQDMDALRNALGAAQAGKGDVSRTQRSKHEPRMADMSRVIAMWAGQYNPNTDPDVERDDEGNVIGGIDVLPPHENEAELSAARLAHRYYKLLPRISGEFMTPDEMADRLTRELLRGGLESAPEDNFQPMAAVAQLRKADAKGNYNVFIQDERTGKIAVNPDIMAGKGGGDEDLAQVSNVTQISDKEAAKRTAAQGQGTQGAQDIVSKAEQDAQFFQSPEVFVDYVKQAIDTGDLQQAIDVVNMGQPEDWQYAMEKLPAWAQNMSEGEPKSQARLAALKDLQKQFRVEPLARECIEQLIECVEQSLWSRMYDLSNRWV